MDKSNKVLIEYYLNAHKNIWNYIYEQLKSGNTDSIETLKGKACSINQYNFRCKCNCALCELFYNSNHGYSECDLCTIITGLDYFKGCLGGLYDKLLVSKDYDEKVYITYKILHCVDNWEENAKKGGLI